MTSKFSTQHYNAIAKDIRKELEEAMVLDDKRVKLTVMSAVCKIALRLALRFKVDNDQFDQLKFLDQCSPDLENYPLSELWDDYVAQVSR